MRGSDANALVSAHESATQPITDRSARYALVTAIARAIEDAYRQGLTTGREAERERMRAVLGL